MNGGLHDQYGEYSADFKALQRVMAASRDKRARKQEILSKEYDEGQRLIETWVTSETIVDAADYVRNFFARLMHQSNLWRGRHVVSRQQRLLQSITNVYGALDGHVRQAPPEAQSASKAPLPADAFRDDLRKWLDVIAKASAADGTVAAGQFGVAREEVAAVDPFSPKLEVDKAKNWYLLVLGLVQYGMVRDKQPGLMNFLAAKDRANFPAMATLAEDLFAVTMTRYVELAFSGMQQGEDMVSREIKMGNLASFAAGLKDLYPDIADARKYDHLSLELGMYLSLAPGNSSISPERILNIFEHVLQSHTHAHLEAGTAALTGEKIAHGSSHLAGQTEADAAAALIEGYCGENDPRRNLSVLRVIDGRVQRHP